MWFQIIKTFWVLVLIYGWQVSSAHWLPQADSIWIRALIDSSELFHNRDRSRSIAYASRAIDDSERVNQELLKGWAQHHLGRNYIGTDSVDLAATLFNKADTIASQYSDDKLSAAIANSRGILAKNAGDLDDAMALFILGLKKYESIDDELGIASVCINIGVIYDHQGDLKNAKIFFERALQSAQKADNALYEGKAWHSLAIIACNTGDLQGGLRQFKASLSRFQQAQNGWDIINTLNNLGYAYKMLGNLDSALIYSDMAIQEAQEMQNPELEMRTLTTKGNLLEESGQLDQAERILTDALSKTKELNMRTWEERTLGYLAKLKEKQGDYVAALSYFKQYTNLRDSLKNETTQDHISELQVQYETEKKENELKQAKLNIQKAETKKLWWILIALGLFLSAGFFILYFRQRLKANRRITQQQKALMEHQIAELENTQSILSLNAMIGGQEAERKRIAKNLHDGVSSMLSTLNLHLIALQDQSLRDERSQLLQKTQKLLDQTAQEVRRIAHDMMPGSLSKLGLVPSLHELKEDIEGVSDLHINLQSIDMNLRLDEDLEVMIFRTVQELVNNITKHAEAKNVLIELSRQGDQINLTVEDDGKGFEYQSTDGRGMGLRSIRSRIDHYGGHFDLHSQKGRGTSISIMVPISKLHHPNAVLGP
ncbi:MAG: tetratricopeptide repeat protein [Saprospiraceae bacterium]|nr:tetratricopeptide repeat protein [Saprospiraceae bacterium]